MNKDIKTFINSIHRDIDSLRFNIHSCYKCKKNMSTNDIKTVIKTDGKFEEINFCSIKCFTNYKF